MGVVVIEGLFVCVQDGVWKMVSYGYLVIWKCGKVAGFRIRPMFKSWLCSVFIK